MTFVFQFGWPYIARYKARFVTGILLGICFGLVHAIYPVMIKSLAERIHPPVVAIATEPVQKAADKKTDNDLKQTLLQKAKHVGARLEKKADSWLPRAGNPLTWKQIVGCLLLPPILIGLRGLLGYLSSYYMAWVSLRVMTDMQYDVMVKLHSLSLDYFNRAKTGDLMARIGSDTGSLYRCLNLGLSDLVKEPITIMGVLCGLFIMDWQLTLISLVFMPLCVAPVVAIGRKVKSATQGMLKATIGQSSHLLEGFANIRVVKAFRLEEVMKERFRHFAHQNISNNMRATRATQLVNPVIEFSSAFGISALLLFIFISGRTIPDLLAFVTGILLFFGPVKKLAGIHVLFQTALVGVERLRETMGERPSVQEPITPATLPPFSKQIEMRNVSFSYGDQPILQNIEMTIRKGQKIGIAGESGSGKSTLINLLFRFYDPTDGGIFMDGVNLRDASLDNLRQQMALVSQDVFLFDMSVAENIRMGRLNATLPEIEDASRHAFAHDFISQMSQGYETRVGERATRLSGGQKQRISIARAFIHNAPVLILDEATAALDSNAEAEVQKAIDHLAENRTAIMIAHRLSTLENCDEIIVLEKGRIVERGKFRELIAQQGTFSQMARKQGIA